MNTEDRELLRLAAKAAGLPLGYGDGQYFYCEHGPFGAGMYGKLGDSPLNWNPLADDGAALRLAVALGLSVMFDRDRVQVSADDGGEYCTAFAMESINSGESATRRAIVRAAAAIGAAMP